MDQPPLPDIEPYVNRNLFSDHFLRELLPQDESWQVDEDGLKLAMQSATNLYAGRDEEWAHSNEPQLENRLVRPVLQALGHKFEVQPSLPTPETVRRPDYAFFGTDEERLKAKRDHDGQAEYFNKAIAVGDAKRWDRSLDKKDRSGRDSFDMLSPSWQIDYYLRMSGVKWGILTNGRLWRLYSQDTSFRLDICYEIDLPRLLAAKDLAVFKYFYLFFTREAFVPDAEGLCFLDRVYQGSLEYAQAVGDDLKENVYKALRLLAEGFLHTQGNDLDPVRDLDEIHANSLVLLYRLLFINYAEDRGLLPRDNALYKESYGLVSMEREIASKLQRGDSLSPLHTTYWGKLKTLFELINRGTGALAVEAETMEVPPYNGGLFDPDKHPFLEQHEVADKWVSQVVDLLARSQGEGLGRGFVDYSSLDVRHLGSIYEGLLEYKPRVADEEMVAVKRGGKEQWIPAGEAEGSRVLDRAQPGSVYLATDRGERKATGSYYTPDYIVKYIVEHTVGPLVEERMKGDDPIDGILSLKVLDPAMGSGHFLVEATDRLAHALVEALGVTEKEPEGEDIRWARREVVERCIYGVDLNPLAVELAKLSLWLHTVAEGKPLNFLDHHLKVGNSLLGAWVEHLERLPVRSAQQQGTAGQPPLFEQGAFTKDVGLAVAGVSTIQDLASDTVQNIREKDRILQEVLGEHLKKWRRVADLWTSAFFGNEMTPEMYRDLVQRVRTGEGKLPAEQAEAYEQRAQSSSRDERFFHWELEFPEVFYDRYGRHLGDSGGFDAVGGNPPYVSFGLGRTGKLPEDREAFLRATFQRSAEYKISIYALFMEACIRRCRIGGYASLIVPDSFLSGKYFSKVRGFLLRESELQRLIVFDRDFWESGDVGFPTIFVARKRSVRPERDAHARFLYARVSDPEDLYGADIAYVAQDQGAQLHNPGMRLYLLSPSSQQVVDRMRHRVVRLGQLLEMHHGIRSKVGRDAIIAHERLGHEWKKAVVSSSEVGRYSLLPEGHFIWINPDLLFSGGWDSRHIEQPKLLVRRTGDAIVSAVDVRGYYHTNALIYGIPTGQDRSWDLFALCSILNSRLLNFYYQSTTMKQGRTFPQVEIDTLSHLPIRRIEFSTAAGPRNRRVQRAQRLDSQDDERAVLGVIEDALATEPEETDIAHDLLAYLALQMTDVTSEERAEATAFLDWLTGYTRLPIDQWRLKTVLKAYWQQGWDEFQRALRQNRKAIEQASGRNVESREAQESIRGELDKSTAKLDPLLKRIASTDRLIDLIVYRLYGLTEEEVAIVEGRA